MNNNEITFLDDNTNNVNQFNNSSNNQGFIQTIEPNKPNNMEIPKTTETQIDDTIKIPDWDLTPPFDSIDRSDML